MVNEPVVTDDPAASRMAGPDGGGPRRRRRVTRWLTTVLWLGVFAAAGTAVYRDASIVPRALDAVRHLTRREALVARRAPPRVVPVSATAARRTDVSLFLDGLGYVTAFNTVTVGSRVDGELIRVAFQEGEFVREGDLLAEIDPRPFEVQLRQAEGQLARDQAALTAAQLDLERYESLASLKQITGQQIDSQRALVRQCEAATQIDRGAIDNVQLQLDFCRVTAPISGRIGLRIVDAGNIVHANDPAGLAVIAQVQPIAIVFTIPQDEVVRVQRALASAERLAVDAYNRDFRVKLASGSLLAIDNQVDTATGTVRLKAVFANEDGTLFPNQFVNARLLVEQLPGAIVVPAAAVQRGPQSAFVYVVQPDATAALRTVTTGPAEDDLITIIAGLEPGDLVVTDGIDKITDKAKVAVRGTSADDSVPAAVAARPGPGGPAAESRP